MIEKEELLEQLGDGYTNKVVDRLHSFAYIPPHLLASLAKEALNEEWGRNNYALEKYLAIHIPWAIEQGRFTTGRDQFYITAGNLQTRYGTPLYLAFSKNSGQDTPWRLAAAGTRISAPELPPAPEIPPKPEAPIGLEIVMMHDHILGDNAERVSFLANTPPVAQMCAVAGAIQWSLNRGLQMSYWYFGKMQLLVPLYLQTRENIALAPDAVAPIQVNQNNLLVRTVLPAHAPYANARVAVHRHDQLPPWLLDTWASVAQTTSAAQIEDPET
jgi:hypothetical protein